MYLALITIGSAIGYAAMAAFTYVLCDYAIDLHDQVNFAYSGFKTSDRYGDIRWRTRQSDRFGMNLFMAFFWPVMVIVAPFVFAYYKIVHREALGLYKEFASINSLSVDRLSGARNTITETRATRIKELEKELALTKGAVEKPLSLPPVRRNKLPAPWE